MHRIEDRLTEVENRIRHASQAFGRNRDELTLLAVSKKQNAEKIAEAQACGLHDFGENYLQEALDKQQVLSHLDLTWHFIGPIQSNKTKAIATNFDWVHTVDRAKIAERLNSQRDQDAPLNVCIQVNIDKEPSKSGVLPDKLTGLAKIILGLPNLRLRGLMVIPQVRHDLDSQRQVFATIRLLKKDLEKALQIKLDTLSMGMSADLEAAIAEDATIVRIGTALFGERTEASKV